MQALDRAVDGQFGAALGDVLHGAFAPPSAVDPHHLGCNPALEHNPAVSAMIRLDRHLPRSSPTFVRLPQAMIPVRWLTAGKSSPESGSRRRDVGEVPVAQRAKCGMCERTLEVSPDPRLVAQIVRLAIAAVEAGKGAEQARVAL